MMEGRPGAAAFASPELLIDAEVVSEEVHVTVEVMSAMLPSLKAPAAANCWVAPAAMVVPVGVTAMDFNVAGGVTGGGEDSDPQEYKVPAAMLHNNSTNLRSVPPGRLYRGVSRKPTPLRVIFAGISLPSAAFAVTSWVWKELKEYELVTDIGQYRLVIRLDFGGGRPIFPSWFEKFFTMPAAPTKKSPAVGSRPDSPDHRIRAKEGIEQVKKRRTPPVTSCAPDW
jgi:hypothetical protein